MKKVIIFSALLALSICGMSQTPGLILRNGGAGAAILDPDADGYVSTKTDGVQIGFTSPPNSDFIQSEIPYVPIVKVDPLNDLEQAQQCDFTELIGNDTTDNYAALMYYDGTNVLFRVRIGKYITNSKSYSILIDTDGKIGFDGPNKDPNAIPGNPGFEVEIVMMTKFSVAVYNVDGTIEPQLEYDNDYYDYSQQSRAQTSYCDDPDYLFDFYIPFSQLTSIPGLNITSSTPLRFAILTCMNPGPAIGNNAQSDVGGASSGTIDQQLIDVIEAQSPNDITEVNDGIEEISICPPINTVMAAQTTITGTTTEANGTVITVSAYQSDGTTLLGTTSTTATSGAWSVNVNTFSPSVTLAVGQIIKAAAEAPGKSISGNECNTIVAENCIVQTEQLCNCELSIVGGDKGYVLSLARPTGTKVYLYNSNYTLVDVSMLKYGVTNPFITTSANQVFSYECQTGFCFENDVYYFRIVEPNECISELFVSCYYAKSGTSSIPNISTNPVTESSTTISGTANSASAQILFYINSVFNSHTTASSSSPYNYSFNVSGLSLGDIVSVKQIEEEKCISAQRTITVTRQAYPPEIKTTECNVYPLSSINGTSVEDAGTSISVYKINGIDVLLGTTTVLADHTWSITGLNLNAGDSIMVRIPTQGFLTQSNPSDTISFVQRTDISAYTIRINAAREGDLSLGGTISGGTYPVALDVYIDGVYLSTCGVLAPGNWIITGLAPTDLLTSAVISIKITEQGKCESLTSSAQETVLCQLPLEKNISTSTSENCLGKYGNMIIHNSEPNVYYIPVLASDSSVFGYGEMGTGADITLTTYLMTENVSLKVLASKIPIGTCENYLDSVLSFIVNPLPSNPRQITPQYFCHSGTLNDILVEIDPGNTLLWFDAAEGGNLLAGTTQLVDGVTYYALSHCDSTSCQSIQREPITAEMGLPVAPEADMFQTKCFQSTLYDISIQMQGPGTAYWYTGVTGGTALDPNTPLVDNATYYVESIHQNCKSATRTEVSIDLAMVPDTTVWVGDESNEWNNRENWTSRVPTVCTHVIIPDVGNGVAYPIITGPAFCKSITFEPGGAVLGLKHLTYEQAYVQLKVQRTKWYTLTAPLKNMYSGDYGFTGTPVAYMRLFDDFDPDNIADTIAVGTWTRTFANLGVPLNPGMGYAFQTSTKEFNYPNPTNYVLSDKTFYFPRQNTDGSLVRTMNYYSGISGKINPYKFETLTRDSAIAFRFAMENADSVLTDIFVPIKNGLNLIGNPLMTHLDFNEFYADNQTKISEKVKFWNGTTFTTYMVGSGIYSDMNMDYTSIPPMQSFFVEGFEDDSVLFDLDAHFKIDLCTKLRSGNINSNLLHIQSQKGIYKSSTAIKMQAQARNSFGNEDAFKLFTQYKSVPEVYSLADNVALDINQFSTLPYTAPIGIKNDSSGIINLKFQGAESFEGIDVTLMNTKTGEQQNLKLNNEYALEFETSDTDGFLFIQFRNANTATEVPEAEYCSRCIQVFMEDEVTLSIISAPDEEIKDVYIWEQEGRLVSMKDAINNNRFKTKIEQCQAKICVVRVVTSKNTYITKVMVK